MPSSIVIRLLAAASITGIVSAPTRAEIPVFFPPTRLPAPINAEGTSNGNPSISADGLTLYWQSRREPSTGRHDIWYSTRSSRNDEWQEPINLGAAVNTAISECYPSISPDETTLFFSRSETGCTGRDLDSDIWMTTRASLSAPWQAATDLGSNVNTMDFFEGKASISTDGLELYIGSNREFGVANRQIWLSTRTSPTEEWGIPSDIGPPVNTLDEYTPTISADGLTLFFSRARISFDIYVATRQTIEDPWTTAVSLGPGINRTELDISPSVTADGSLLFFRAGPRSGPGEIWQAKAYPMDLPRIKLIEKGSDWSFFRGTEEPTPEKDLQWATVDFDDSDWDVGQEGLGYTGGRGDVAPESIVTTLSDMEDSYVSIYMRSIFSVDDLDEVQALLFRADYDDNYVAYVNGIEVGRTFVGDVGAPHPYDRGVLPNRSGLGQLPLAIDLSVNEILHEGDNVLAIHAINANRRDDDFLISDIELFASVPEPASFVLLLAGVIGLTVRRRRLGR